MVQETVATADAGSHRRRTLRRAGARGTAAAGIDPGRSGRRGRDQPRDALQSRARGAQPVADRSHKRGAGARVSLAELLGDEDRRPVVTIPKAERLVFRDPATGIERQLLSPAFAGRGIEFIRATLPPFTTTDDLVRTTRPSTNTSSSRRARCGSSSARVPPLAGGRRLLLPGQRLTPLREPRPRALQLPGDPRLRPAWLTNSSIRVLTTGHGGCTFTVRQTRTGAIPNAGGKQTPTRLARKRGTCRRFAVPGFGARLRRCTQRSAADALSL